MFPMRKLAVAILTVLAVVTALAGCGRSRTAAPTPGSPTTTAASGVSRVDAAGTVWLCRPGLADDPCTGDLDTTVVPAQGPRTVEQETSVTQSKFDCFYIYPTVSSQVTDNASLAVEPAETDVAVSQASPFSQVCDVWAPMYRQLTVPSLFRVGPGTAKADLIAYQSILAGWNDYFTNYNDGRPVIFIGHSQGSAMLIKLLESQVDNNPTMRARMVSAIIAGGNVAVPIGGTVGATFQHLPLCTSATETTCVIAYSTFPSEPPAGSLFGRPGLGVSIQSGQSATSAVQVACVNPAALSGGTAGLTPDFPVSISKPPPPAVTTRWVTYPGLYSATCHSAGGATWLEVDKARGAGDPRPLVTEALGPAWGYHLDDINLPLGNLVADVRGEEAAYRPSP